MIRLAALMLTAGLALTGALPAGAALNPLETNLRVLEQRARASKQPAPTAPRLVSRRIRVPRRIAVRPRIVVRPRRQDPVASPGANRFVKYAGERFGAKPRGGDLVVQTAGDAGAVHVYVRQRIVSNGGNGQARVPDLTPGKHPVMVWSPDSGKRRTYWVTVRPGSVAELRATL